MLKMQQKGFWSIVNAIHQKQSDDFGITIILHIDLSDENIINNPILFEVCCEISVRSSARASSDE